MRVLLLAVLLTGLAAAQSPLAALYRQAVDPQVDPTRVSVVENLNFHRDRLQFQLISGELALTKPVGGHLTAAVFRGRGRILVEPSSPIEAHQMELFLGRPEINLSFSQAVFRFARSADFLPRLAAQVRFKPAAEAAAPLQKVLDDRASQIDSEGLPNAARILAGLAAPNPEAVTPWMAELKTRSQDWIEARFDPLEREPVEVMQIRQRAHTGIAAFADTWTRCQSQPELQAGEAIEAEHAAPAHLDDYNLSIYVPGNLDLRAQAALTVTALHNDGPGLFLHLDPNLRLISAATASGEPVAWVQPRDPKRVAPPRYFGNWLYLQLPAALAKGQQVQLRLAYQGKYVISRVGDGNFFVRSMGWYPYEPFGPPIHHASFDLHFNVKKKYGVIATGTLVSQHTIQGRHVSEWRSQPPSTVAGFALGDYKGFAAHIKMPDGSRLTVQAFANTSPDDAFRSIENLGSMAHVDANGNTQFGYNLPPGLENLNPVQMAPKALVSVADAVKFFSFFFGPYPYQKLALVNIPGDYGQGWPSLLYLSSLSFLDPTQLHELGVGEEGLRQLSDTFRAHEVSHQWWGHVVGWNSPHDQWLSEGFANGSAVLYEQLHVKPSAAVATLQEWRRTLFQKDYFGHVPNDLGPVWLGDRLSTSVDPAGYDDVVYDKGGYIFTMLRYMLLNPRLKDPYQGFVNMMHAFTQAYDGKTASTADFENIANQYMTPFMDIDHNHRLDWFFNEYVYHTKVPTIHFQSNDTPLPGGHSMLTVEVENPEGWKGLLPLTLHAGKNSYSVTVRVYQPRERLSIPLPFLVQKVVPNEYEQMLVHIR